jgi:predicted transposase YbfD/YdcC
MPIYGDDDGTPEQDPQLEMCRRAHNSIIRNVRRFRELDAKVKELVQAHLLVCQKCAADPSQHTLPAITKNCLGVTPISQN